MMFIRAGVLFHVVGVMVVVVVGVLSFGKHY